MRRHESLAYTRQQEPCMEQVCSLPQIGLLACHAHGLDPSVKHRQIIGANNDALPAPDPAKKNSTGSTCFGRTLANCYMRVCPGVIARTLGALIPKARPMIPKLRLNPGSQSLGY